MRLLLLATLVAFAQAEPPDTIAIQDVTVIDGTGSPAKPARTVVISNGRIQSVAAGKVTLPKNTQVIPARGKFLIPGLWDMHAHITSPRQLPLFTANGVIGVRIMWGLPFHHQWRKEIAEGTLVGPQLVIASPEVDGPESFREKQVAEWLSVANEEDGRRAVQRAIETGADFVKVYSFLPRLGYFTIAAEAKKRGISFVGHCPDSLTAAECSNAGQKSMEHLNGTLLEDISGRQEELKGLTDRRARFQATIESFSEQQASELFALFRKNRTWHCPTLTMLRGRWAFRECIKLDDDPRLRFVPLNLRDEWAKRSNSYATSPGSNLRMRMFEYLLAVVGRMHRAGVDIMTGSDYQNPYCFPGFGVHDELELLVRAGLSPMEAIRAATYKPAEFLGKLDSLGTIEVGKTANLVLLDANPLENIANSQKINAVVLRGRLFVKEELGAMLSKAEIEVTKGWREPGQVFQFPNYKGNGKF